MFDGAPDLQLIHRGSVHGFSAKAFHANCDAKGSTLTLVKSTNYQRVFGGFTDIDWEAGDPEDDESQNKNS